MLKDKDSKQSIQVTIRVRPLSEKQKFQDPRVCVHLQQSHSLSLVNAGDTKKFTFDSISYEQSQEQIFERVGRRTTKDCLQGYNCTIFAYGQTGAGKTYTMMGVTSDHEHYQQHRGLIPRTMNYLFDCIDQERAEGVTFIIRCSFLEIYNEQIIDLLNKNNTNLQLREDTRKGVYVEGITELVVAKSDEIMDLLHKGSKSRHVGSTYYNQTSSRSHSVFTMSIESKYTKNGVVNTKSRSFNFIDLAGSERTKMSTGERLKQGCNINKSLMNLASVINSLSQVSEGKMQHVNYRNSKLTFLLKDSLGGNSKTNLIANISPSTMFYQETLSTLSFARRAKLIKRERASINEDSSGNLDSMKNEIKRLKQEVITLMGRLQSGSSSGGSATVSSSSAPQMTSIMHQYVAQEIDKQTRLQMQILRLNERISHLQDGIKHYASSQTHLRMIIAVLQDKITRLKSVENRLSFNMEEMDTDEERVKAVKEYFQKEREGLIKQVEAFKGQSEGTRIVKELLKQAKVMREDGQQEQTLKQLLTKNTSFLSMIHSKLEQIAPEKQEIEFNADFEKKVSQIQIEYHKKEEQLMERMQQLGLQLNESQNRNEQNEKLLEDAISTQIGLQQKVKAACSEKEQLQEYLRSQQTRRKDIEEELQKMMARNEEAVTELKNDLSNKEMEESLLKNEVETLKVKIEKMATNEKYLKEQFDSLEQEKYKLDKTLVQNIEEMKEKKNELTKKDSEISMLKQELQTVQKQLEETQQSNKNLSAQFAQQKKSNKIKLQEVQSLSNKQLQQQTVNQEKLSLIVEQLEAKLKQTERRLSEESEQLEMLAKQFGEMETSLKKTIESKETELKETIALINQKEENGNEIQFSLNQIKAELINVRAQKENSETKLNKIIEDLKEKIEKERHSFEQLETQVNQRSKIHEELVKEQTQKRKELNELKQQNSRLGGQNLSLKKELQALEGKVDKLQSELDSIRQKEKEQRVAIMEVRNELFVAQKNSQIEIDALKSQLTLKEQHAEQTDKQHSKNKLKYEKEIGQLQQELKKSKEMFEQHEKSMKKSMESHLLSKEKKVTELRAALTQKENLARQSQITITEQAQRVRQLQSEKANQQSVTSQLKRQIEKLLADLEELKQEQEQLLVNHQKQFEELQITHNSQLDQKTEQIQNYMNQIESLTQQNEALKSSVKNQQDKLLKERKQKAHLQVEYNTLQATTAELNNEIQELSLKNKALEDKRLVSEEKVQVLEHEKEESQQELQNIVAKLQIAKQEAQQLEQQLQEQKESNKQLQQSLQETKIRMERNFAEKIEDIQKQMNSSGNQQATKIGQLQIQLQNMKNTLESSEQSNKEARQKLNEANKFARDLSKALQTEKSQASNLQASIRRLEDEKYCIEEDKKKHQQTIKTLKEELKEFQALNDSLNKDLQLQIQELQTEIAKKQSTIEELNNLLEKMKQQIIQKDKNIEQIYNELADLNNTNQSLSEEIMILGKKLKDVEEEKQAQKEKISNYEIAHADMSAKFEENAQYKQKWQLQNEQLQSLREKIVNQEQAKERLYGEVCKERQNCSNLKLIIENSEAQVRQLALELEEKDNIYKKLLEKIAKNENQNRKSTNNSEHYLKTIELLEKSRSEQLEMRRQNQDLRKKNEEQSIYIKQVEKKSEGYCVSMHKRLQQIQKDYFELEKHQQKLIKEKKSLEKCSNENEILKEEIRNMKASANKMVQRQEELENRFKKCNIDYIELEKEFEELKKGQTMINNHDDKTGYINRLKAEVAALKTEKVLLTDSLNKQREEKTKLKAEMRYGKDGAGDLGVKIDLEKKINENKNLQELIFEIVSHLKICVNEPRTKLETIRSVILNTIKDKNSEIKSLRERLKQVQDMQEAKHMMVREPALRDYKGFNYSLSKNPGGSEELRFEKDKDPSVLNNSTRQKVKNFQNYYANNCKQGDRAGKYRNN